MLQDSFPLLRPVVVPLDLVGEGVAPVQVEPVMVHNQPVGPVQVGLDQQISLRSIRPAPTETNKDHKVSLDIKVT